MAELEKVIKALEFCTTSEDCRQCVYWQTIDNTGCQAMKDALELLKEQQIVRCKDCKHYRDGFCYNPNTYDDEKTRGNTVPDWFCADGEREE